MKSLPKLISLDAAGTLIAPAVSVGQTYADVAKSFGVNLTAVEVEQAFREAFSAAPNPYPNPGVCSSDGDRAWWQDLVLQVFASVGWQGAGREAAFDRLFAHYAEPEAWRLCPGVAEALPRLSQLAPLWIVSNFDPRLHGVLDGLGIGHHFAGRILSSEVGAAKPHQLIFEALLQSAGVVAGECLHVGDDPRCDWRGAAACGINVWELGQEGKSLADLTATVEAL